MPSRILLAGLPEEMPRWLGGRLPDVAIATAATGTEALTALAGGGWAAVVLHQGLTDPAGIETAARIRAHLAPERLPIILCRDRPTGRRRLEALARRLGGLRLEPCPLDRESLARELAALLGTALLPAEGVRAGLGAAVAQIWMQFRGVMFERLAAAEAAATAAAAGRLSEEVRRRGERECHKLVGALGTFGLVEGSRLAREIERILGGATPLAPADVQRLSDRVRALRRLLEEAGAVGGAAAHPTGP